MFRKAIIVVLLLVTPFAQARVLLLCSMTHDAPVEQCACPAQHHQQLPTQQADHGDCCTVDVEVTARELAATSGTAAAALPTKAAWTDVPALELTVFESPHARVVVDVAATSQLSSLAALANAPPRYLDTARLRL